MPVSIKYIGTQVRWPELSITGKQSVWIPGQQEERSDAEANSLLATGLFAALTGSQVASSSFTLAASDDGKVFNVTTAITVTFPAGLSPKPNVGFVLPPSGSLTIAVSGGANINGATTTLTRARSANPAGIVVQPYTESDGYGVSGS